VFHLGTNAWVVKLLCVQSAGGSVFIVFFAILYLGGIVLLIAAIAVTVVSLVRVARAAERIAHALEQRPPG
jgi:hypothetical protein